MYMVCSGRLMCSSVGCKELIRKELASLSCIGATGRNVSRRGKLHKVPLMLTIHGRAFPEQGLGHWSQLLSSLYPIDSVSGLAPWSHGCKRREPLALRFRRLLHSSCGLRVALHDLSWITTIMRVHSRHVLLMGEKRHTPQNRISLNGCGCSPYFRKDFEFA